MVFKIKNKVALVTGGASGIGLELVKELLNKEAKGVTVADINFGEGEKVIKELRKKFGEDRVVFVWTDIANCTSFENVFKITLDTFKNIDILINNAAICNDKTWEKEIDINLKGTAHGMILGLETYLKEHKQSEEAVIVNTASPGGYKSYPTIPIYCASKAGVLALTKCWGQSFHYDRTKVRVLAISPGSTDTPIVNNVGMQLLKPEYAEFFEKLTPQYAGKRQSPEFVAQETVKLIENAPNGSVWVIEKSKPAYQYISQEIN